MFKSKKKWHYLFILLVTGWVYLFIVNTITEKTSVEILFRLAFAAVIILIFFSFLIKDRQLIMGLLVTFIISWLFLVITRLDFQVSNGTIEAAITLILLILVWLSFLVWQRFKNVIYTDIQKRVGLITNNLLFFVYLIVLIYGYVYLMDDSYKLSLLMWLSAGILLLSFYLFNKMFQPLGKNIAIIQKRDKPVAIKKGDISLILKLKGFYPLNAKGFRVKLEIVTLQGEIISSLALIFVSDSQSETTSETTYHYYNKSFFALEFQFFGAKKKALLCKLVSQ